MGRWRGAGLSGSGLQLPAGFSHKFPLKFRVFTFFCFFSEMCLRAIIPAFSGSSFFSENKHSNLQSASEWLSQALNLFLRIHMLMTQGLKG